MTHKSEDNTRLNLLKNAQQALDEIRSVIAKGIESHATLAHLSIAHGMLDALTQQPPHVISREIVNEIRDSMIHLKDTDTRHVGGLARVLTALSKDYALNERSVLAIRSKA